MLDKLNKFKIFFNGNDIYKILILIVLIILFLCLAFNIYTRYIGKLIFEDETLKISENNSKEIFSINQIYSFSSATAENTTEANAAYWKLSNLSQYTDIAFFIDNNVEELGLTLENSIKELYITDIKFAKLPSYGTPKLYYKNVNDFGKNSYSDEYVVADNISFDIVSENINFSKPQLYNNCSNPITIGYLNSNIEKEFNITDTNSALVFNGSLLKKANISLSSLDATISFKINIVNNLGQHFVCDFIYDIPLKNDDTNSSIYDGSYTLKKDNLKNYVFYRTK